MERRGRVSLAGGSLLDVSPARAVEIAAEAGFDRVGLRVTGTTVDDAALRLAGRRVTDLAFGVLDVEFARLTPDGRHDDGNRRLLEQAAELGAEHLLVVSLIEDELQAADSLVALAQHAEGAATQVALEFMRFSGVPSLAAARRVVEASQRDDLSILIDTLHLARAGESADDVESVPDRWLSYAQLCDAPATGPDDLAELAWEARHARLLPGQGELPLSQVLDALPPGIDLSVEVLADDLASLPPQQRADRLWDATGRFLSSRS